MRRERSIDPAYFESLFRNHGDPWDFQTSAYEHAKYDHTLASLPQPRFSSVLEVGCANGVLTQRLAAHCERLVSVDVSETALRAAAAHCAAHSNILFERRQLPCEGPEGSFDLVLLSEVVYYWDDQDLVGMADFLRRAVPSGGYLLLVHWTGVTDYPKSGDDAVIALRALLGSAIRVVNEEVRDQYRLDLWQRI